MKIILRERFCHILLLSIFIFSSCDVPEPSEDIKAVYSLTIDGEPIEIDAYDISTAVIWKSWGGKYDLKIYGKLPSVDGENGFFEIGATNYQEFEVGNNPNIESVSYSLNYPNSKWFSTYDYFGPMDPEKIFEEVHLQFTELDKYKINGKLSLVFDYEGKRTEHEFSFDITSNPDRFPIIDHTGPEDPSGGGDDGDGDSGSSTDCSLSNYEGPEFDIQIDSQCKLAYQYDCAGAIQQRDVACKLYYEYGNQVWTGSGSLPQCQYCP